jgi:hypothetical protein
MGRAVVPYARNCGSAFIQGTCDIEAWNQCFVSMFRFSDESRKPEKREIQFGGSPMSKKAAEHHKMAAEHHTHAARHHSEAAKHHDAGQHEKAGHHAHTARGHAIHSRDHSDEAAKAHGAEHGKK